MSELVNSLAKQLQGDTSDLELDTVYQEVFVKSLCVYWSTLEWYYWIAQTVLNLGFCGGCLIILVLFLKKNLLQPLVKLLVFESLVFSARIRDRHIAST